MSKYINKDVIVAEIEKRFDEYSSSILRHYDACTEARASELGKLLVILNTLEGKDVDSIMHTIIAECCDWLAICTDLNHDLIEDCRNLMLAIKEEQFKVQKGE